MLDMVVWILLMKILFVSFVFGGIVWCVNLFRSVVLLDFEGFIIVISLFVVSMVLFGIFLFVCVLLFIVVRSVFLVFELFVGIVVVILC